MSDGRLLSALNVAESVKKSERKNFAGIESRRNEDCDANKILKKTITMPDPTKTDKTITEIREQNYDTDEILRDIKASLYEPEEDHYKPIKTANAFNNNYI